jgi:hypothetical protein
VCFGASGEGTLEVSFQGGNAQIPSSLLHHYATRLLSYVDSLSFCFSYTLDLV